MSLANFSQDWYSNSLFWFNSHIIHCGLNVNIHCWLGLQGLYMILILVKNILTHSYILKKWVKMDLFRMILKNKGLSKTTNTMSSKWVETKIEFHKLVLEFTYRDYACQFAECQRTTHFYNTDASLPITYILSPHFCTIAAANLCFFRSGNSPIFPPRCW